MQFLLKNIWAALGQAWDKELSAKHSKLFKDWCSEMREITTMSISRLYFESSNLRLHIFADASEEAMCIVAYLQDEATLKLTHVIGNCSTNQTQKDSEVRISSCSLRNSSHESGFEGT